MKKFIFTLNWKANPTTLAQGQAILDCYPPTNHKVVTYCPSIFVGNLKTSLTLGVQDICEFENGAYTGQITASQVSDMGISHTMIGHGETHNTPAQVLAKVKLALENGIHPLVCVGSVTESFEDLIEQLDVLKKIDYPLWIGYEPIWAIGTGKTPTMLDIETTIGKIKNYLGKDDIKVLYGGSVSSKNIEELKAISNLDGFVVGGACLKSSEIQILLS